MLVGLIEGERDAVKRGPHYLRGGSLLDHLVYFDDVARGAHGVWGVEIIGAILSRGCLPLLEAFLSISLSDTTLDRCWNSTVPCDVVHSLTEALLDISSRVAPRDKLRSLEQTTNAMGVYWDRLKPIVEHYVGTRVDRRYGTRCRVRGLYHLSYDNISTLRDLTMPSDTTRALIDDVLLTIGIFKADAVEGAITRSGMNQCTLLGYLRNRSDYMHDLAGQDQVYDYGKTHRGKTYEAVHRRNRDYASWCLGQSRMIELPEVRPYLQWCAEWCHKSGYDSKLLSQMTSAGLSGRIRAIKAPFHPTPRVLSSPDVTRMSYTPSNAYIVIDTETTGLRADAWPPHQYELYDNTRITEIAWVVVIEGRVEHEESYLLSDALPALERVYDNPYVRVTSGELKTRGVGWNVVINALSKAVALVTHVVMHNTQFDMNMIAAELFRHRARCLSAPPPYQQDAACSIALLTTLIDKEHIDTVYGITGTKRMVKLEDLHRFLLRYPPINPHRALDDVHSTRRCYEAIMARLSPTPARPPN